MLLLRREFGIKGSENRNLGPFFFFGPYRQKRVVTLFNPALFVQPAGIMEKSDCEKEATGTGEGGHDKNEATIEQSHDWRPSVREPA